MSVIFSAGGSATANGSVTNLASATSLYGKYSVSEATLAAVTGASNITIVAADDKGSNSKIQVQISQVNGTTLEAKLLGSNQDSTSVTCSLAYASLPAGDIIIAFFWTTFNSGIALISQSGTLLTSGTHNTGVALVTGTAGYVRVNTPPVVHASGAVSGAGTWNGGGIYSGTSYDTTFASASWYAPPAVADANIVVLHEMNDALSGTSPSSVSAQVGAQPLALSATDFTWANDIGGWFPSIVGGLASFTSTGLANNTVSNANISALTVGSFVMKFGVDVFNMGTNPKNHGLFQIDDGTDANCKISAYIKTPSTSTWQIGFSIPGVGNFLSANFTQSQPTNPLPAFGAGNEVIGYFWWNNTTPTHGVSLFDSLGNLIATLVDTTNRVALPVYTNGGQIRVNYSQDATNNAANPNLVVDGFAIYSQQRVSGSEWVTPSRSNAGLVAFYRFDEQTGTTTQDDLGGPSLALTGFSWEAGGTWYSPPSTTVTSPSVSSTSQIAGLASGVSDTTGFIAVSSAPVEPITGLASTTSLAVVSGFSPTLWVAGLASTSAVGTITIFTSSATAVNIPVTGVQALTAVGLVTAVPFAPTAVNDFAAISHLDRKLSSNLSPTYNASTDTTTWYLPYSVNVDQKTQGHLTVARTDLNLWFEDTTQAANRTITVTRPSPTTIAVTGGGNLVPVPVVVGVIYTSSFQLSTIYERNEKGGVEQRGRLRLGYMEFSYEPMTNMSVVVTPQGRAPYTYTFNDPTAQGDMLEVKPFKFPIQARNEDTTILITDSTPGSFRPVILDWEATLTIRARGV